MQGIYAFWYIEMVSRTDFLEQRYIYAFYWDFYPKQLTLHYTTYKDTFYQFIHYMEIKPMTLGLRYSLSYRNWHSNNMQYDIIDYVTFLVWTNK